MENAELKYPCHRLILHEISSREQQGFHNLTKRVKILKYKQALPGC
jgi:hypothetical protein